jgi:hypothetical protein
MKSKNTQRTRLPRERGPLRPSLATGVKASPVGERVRLANPGAPGWPLSGVRQ